MNDMSYPLTSVTWDDEEITSLQEVIASGQFTMGEHVGQFEEEFATFIGSRYAIMVNSGSSANLAAVAALFYRKSGALQRGNEVIVPAVSWSTTFFPLAQYGLKLKFVDVDADTLNMDLEKVAAAISEKTRLLIAVNLLGNPNDFERLKDLIADRDILLIEDNCESMGATFHGRQAGTFGLMGTFSSFFSHHISTIEGGLVVTEDEELYHILLALRAHGWTRNLPPNNHVYPDLKGDPFYESFLFVLPGYNLRPLEFSGALGCKQLVKLTRFIAERRNNARKFQELFGDHPHVAIQQEVGQSSWFGFALVIRSDAPYSRNELVKALADARIECRPIVSGNFTRNPAVKWMDYTIACELTNANHIHDAGLFVGNHHYDLSAQLEYLADIVQSLAGN